METPKEGKYDIFYTDPPWAQNKGGLRKSRPKQGRELDYKTLNLEDIKALHVEFFRLCDRKHNVFIWAIDKYLHETESMMRDLGYTLHARIIWDKENGVAPAFTVRFSHEYLLWFYKKGQMLMPTIAERGKFTTVIREAATKHSRKPEAAYRMIEAMFPGARKIELFARNRRPGWVSWGDEVPPQED